MYEHIDYKTISYSLHTVLYHYPTCFDLCIIWK